MTIIKDPGSDRVQAVFLKAHLKLQAKGMAARGVTKGNLLKKAGAITGNKYSVRKPGDLMRAANDLQEYLRNGN